MRVGVLALALVLMAVVASAIETDHTAVHRERVQPIRGKNVDVDTRHHDESPAGGGVVKPGSGSDHDIGSIRKFDADKTKLNFRDFEGVWYQAAVNRKFFDRYEADCTCPLKILQKRNATSGDVKLACVKGKEGKKNLLVMRGTKTLLPHGQFSLNIKGKSLGGKFEKSKPQKITEDVIALDDNKKWIVLHAKKSNGFFVYSRTSKMDRELLKKIFDFIDKNYKLDAKEMKITSFNEKCASTMRPLLRKVKHMSRSSSHSRRSSFIDRNPRIRSSDRDSFIRDFSSGAEPAKKPADDKAKDTGKLDLSMLNGKWFEIARSRKASETYERSCQCGVAFIKVDGNTLHEQCACLNTSAKGDDSFATKGLRLEMDEKQQGVFKAKMLHSAPSKLADADTKEFKVILLALGKDFAACLDADRKIVHLLSRNPKMDADLRKALNSMVESVGINPKELDDVKQDENTCKDFHAKASERLSKAVTEKAKSTSDKTGDKAKTTDKEERKPLMSSDKDTKVKDSDKIKHSGSEGTSNVYYLVPAENVHVAPLMGDIETAAPGSASAAKDSGEPGPRFDTNTLAGNWFAIAASQALYDRYFRGCECNQGFVTAIDADRINKVIAAHNMTDNQLVSVSGECIQDAQSPGLFHCKRLEKQPYGLSAQEKGEVIDRVVLASGKDFALIAEPALNGVVILSRAPVMTAELLTRLQSLIEAIGFDKSQLHRIQQELPQCQAVTQQMQALGKQAGAAAAPAAPAAAPAAPAAPAASTAGPAPAAAAAMAPMPTAKFGSQLMGGGGAGTGSEALAGENVAYDPYFGTYY